MGLFSFIKGQFIEVIEWTDNTNEIVHQFPVYDKAIKMGARLTVRESQAAIFLNEGQIADVFGPGTYTLSTQNMPVLTALKSWKYAFNSPFKADVYFVNTRNFTDQKWGTTNPIMMRDPEFGAIRMRGFGSYAFRVQDPALFLKEIFGTQSSFGSDQIGGYLKSVIVSGVSDLIGEAKIPIMDIAVQYDELSSALRTKLEPIFNAMGLSLSGFFIENISLPEEVEKMIDRKSSMNIAGNLDQYMKFQAAESLRDAANNPDSGLAGAGANLGAGMAMGQMFNQAMKPSADAVEPQPAAPAHPASPVDTEPCAQCGHELKASEKFCPECGTPRPEKKFCTECGGSLSSTMKFCPSCGNKV
ncbi:SPFH domain-containing protein [Paenibacillus sp. OAE614]|uniref:SPFH domain-containing protein n=1 Tax=Paenibacillus sp. OAE614 TaxID=2663804 RepID=UPI00178960B1